MSNSENKTKWFAVVNPLAGSGKTLAQWREAEAILYEKGISYKFVTPETASDSNKRIKAACRNGYRHFIAVGGDGTVHNTLHSIIEFVNEHDGKDVKLSLNDFYLAVLPIGSGNDWARSHNLPNSHSGIIEMMASGQFRPQDVVKAEVSDPETGKITNTAYMANIGGYSFDANVCDVVNFQKAHGVTGKLLYINALKKIALSQKPTDAKVLVDGKEFFNGTLYTISFGNGMYSGGGLCQTPSAVMDDGLLDIMLAPKFALWRIFFNIRKLLKKKTEQIKFLRFGRGASIDVIPNGQGQLVEIDGDIIGRAPLHLEVLPQRINVLHMD